MVKDTIMRNVRRCLVCGKGQFKLKFTVNSYPILRCIFCGFVITDDRGSPRSKVNKEFYSASQYQKFYLSYETKKLLTRRFQKRLREIKKLKSGRGKLIDIGASYGIFLEQARDQGYQVVGNELNKKIVAYLKEKGFNIATGDYINLKLKKLSFDVVCMWDVLEHFKDPEEALLKTRNILKKDGLLALSLPNIESLAAKIAKNRWGWLTPPDHLYHFSPRTLSLFLEKNGFKVVRLYTFNDEEEVISGLSQKLSPWLVPISYLARGPLAIFTKPFISVEAKLLLSGLIVAYAKKT